MRKRELQGDKNKGGGMTERSKERERNKRNESGG